MNRDGKPEPERAWNPDAKWTLGQALLCHTQVTSSGGVWPKGALTREAAG